MARIVEGPTVSTVVIQSYRTEAVPIWIETCMQSVRDWALRARFSYEFVGDEIFDFLPDDYRQVAAGRIPVLTDLGRLLLIRRALRGRFDRAIWVDADVLVFRADFLSVPGNMDYAFCREIWVQPNSRRPYALKCYRNVHNAFCLFERGNPFLDFYIHACERIVSTAAGQMPNQIVGTKLLTALHNMFGLPLLETVGMFSPLVIQDVATGSGEAATSLRREIPGPLAAANLCSSLFGRETDGVVLTDTLMAQACRRLLEEGFAP